VVGQWAVAALVWQPACSFSVLWLGETLHGLGVYGVEISSLPGSLPQPSMSPLSQQDP
jgi:hypothetical protein